MVNRSLLNLGPIWRLETCLAFSCLSILCPTISCQAISCSANSSKFVLYFHVRCFQRPRWQWGDKRLVEISYSTHAADWYDSKRVSFWSTEKQCRLIHYATSKNGRLIPEALNTYYNQAGLFELRTPVSRYPNLFFQAIKCKMLKTRHAWLV